MDKNKICGLTSTELQIMELIAQGYSNNEICNKRSITKTTLKTHIVHIFQKLGFINNISGIGSALRVKAVLKFLEMKGKLIEQ